MDDPSQHNSFAMPAPKTLHDYVDLINRIDNVHEIIPTQERFESVLASLQRKLHIAGKMSKERENELKRWLQRHEHNHYLSCLVVRSSEDYIELLLVVEVEPEESGLLIGVCERFKR